MLFADNINCSFERNFDASINHSLWFIERNHIKNIHHFTYHTSFDQRCHVRFFKNDRSLLYSKREIFWQLQIFEFKIFNFSTIISRFFTIDDKIRLKTRKSSLIWSCIRYSNNDKNLFCWSYLVFFSISDFWILSNQFLISIKFRFSISNIKIRLKTRKSSSIQSCIRYSNNERNSFRQSHLIVNNCQLFNTNSSLKKTISWTTFWNMNMFKNFKKWWKIFFFNCFRLWHNDAAISYKRVVCSF